MSSLSSTTWSWILLLVAGLLEVCWAIGLKYSEGFTRLVPSIFTLTTLAGSMYLLAKASQTLPIGTAYGVCVGVGALGAAVLGNFLFGFIAGVYRRFEGNIIASHTRPNHKESLDENLCLHLVQ